MPKSRFKKLNQNFQAERKRKFHKNGKWSEVDCYIFSGAKDSGTHQSNPTNKPTGSTQILATVWSLSLYTGWLLWPVRPSSTKPHSASRPNAGQILLVPGRSLDGPHSLKNTCLAKHGLQHSSSSNQRAYEDTGNLRIHPRPLEPESACNKIPGHLYAHSSLRSIAIASQHSHPQFSLWPYTSTHLILPFSHSLTEI